jgi:hypothetical protein
MATNAQLINGWPINAIRLSVVYQLRGSWPRDVPPRLRAGAGDAV